MPTQLHVDFAFCSAHRLPYYDGPCSRLHGHNYRLQVTIEGKVDARSGMIQDFDEIRRRVWEVALTQCDHHNLNDFIDNPTGENLVAWMWERLKPALAGLKELRLWETPEYSVTFRED